MKSKCRSLRGRGLLIAALWVSAALAFGQSDTAPVKTPPPAQQSPTPPVGSYSPDLVASGAAEFRHNCSFCHGRDAEGGETGPDLTRSKLVGGDVAGDRIIPVVRNGRPGKGMPSFNFSDAQLASLVAFIHSQVEKANVQGGRRGVDVADLQTGNTEAGEQYFNGAGTCSSCHSPTGDLAGIASRYQGLELEMHMLSPEFFPENATAKVTVTLPSGETISGTLANVDEFTVALRDSSGAYRSWPVSRVKYKLDAPVLQHAALLGKFTDADIHNLMAYLQTLH